MTHPSPRRLHAYALAAAVICLGSSGCDATGPEDDPLDHYGGMVFQSGNVDNTYQVDEGWIYIANEDGSDPVRLEEGGVPAWSPDGRRIAYSGEGWVGGGQADIFVLDLETGEKTRITETGDHDWLPRWSPDGTRISFTRCDNDCRPHIMNADGTGVRAVPGHPWNGSRVTWSPDGTRWLYVKQAELFISDTLGTNEIQLTNNTFADRQPSWSPDGTRIAYLSVGTDGYSWGNASPGVWVIDASGGNRIMLSEPRRDTTKWDPTWSADGTEVLFAVKAPGDTLFELVAARADGTGTVRRLDVVGRSPDVVASFPRNP